MSIFEDNNLDKIEDTKNRRDFLNLSNDDLDVLRGLRVMFETDAEEFVEHFYDHLFQFKESSRFLQDEVLVARLKKFQIEHFKSMLDGDWGEEYNARRRKVGQAHAEIGIEPQLFLGAYNLYLQFFLNRLNKESTDKQVCQDNFTVLLKATLYDIGLTLDAYFTHSTQQIRKALDLYWQANTDLRQFAELTSHDLKTPLATVANLCDEVIDEFGDQMPEEAVNMIAKASSKTFDMSRLIDALLASTKLDIEDDTPQPVNIKKIIENLVKQSQHDLQKKNIHVSIAGEFTFAVGEATRIQESISNVLVNAIKFIDKEPGQISITGTHGTNHLLEIEIKDNGIGIPESELQRVFVPFRRIPSKKEVPGSGLGLYFTKQIVEAYGGKIWAESTLGQGTSFYIQLKIYEEHQGRE